MSTNPSPAVAAALSLIFPGLGQIYAGAVRRGVIWALPTLVLILLGLIVLVSKYSLAGLVTSDATLAVIALEIAFLFYHLAAMIDAYSIAQRGRHIVGVATSGVAALSLILLLVVALALHGYPLYLSVIGNSALAQLFPGRSDVLPSTSFATEPPESIPVEVTDSPAPTTPGSTPSPTATPTEGTSPTPSALITAPPTTFPPLDTPWGDRLNLLLIGSDAGPGRHGGRTDTMILLSVQISTGRAAMFGFPRNMSNVPIEDAAGTNTFNRVWTDPYPPGNGNPGSSLLTNLWQYAYDHPAQFYTPTNSCDPNDPNLDQCLGDARAFRATAGAIQNLAGVAINGIIAVNLEAFRDLVDAIGGVWIDVPQAVYDSAYPSGDGVSPKIIDIPAGCNWFDGIYALAYARSRHQDSDYQRMRRQQLVLTAIRRQFDPLAMLPKADQLLQTAANNLWTTISRDDIPLLAQIASRVNADLIYNVRITPGQGYPSYVTDAEVTSIRSRVQNIFTQAQPQQTPPPDNPQHRCPAPGQTPGPSFNTNPSPSP
jgi:LCP family protein required for cell wall assembly